MKYKIEFLTSAAREFKKLPKQIQKRLMPVIDKLGDDPRPQTIERMKVGDYKVRVGDYRIVYEINDDALLVLVMKSGHRREVYKDL